MKKTRFDIPYVSREQRKGIIVLGIVLLVVQVVLWQVNSWSSAEKISLDWQNTAPWQKELDRLKQEQLDKQHAIRPFNPNFLKADRAKFLGLTSQEWDRLQVYRAQNKYVNSAAEFQQVTHVSDEILQKLSPYFAFPEWVKQREAQQAHFSTKTVAVVDINSATLEQLKAVSGIGEVLAARILDERQKWNGFVDMRQLNFIYGLQGHALQEMKKYFVVRHPPVIHKVNINTASKETLQHIPYVTSYLATQMLIYRSKLDREMVASDLEKINGMPLDRLDIIALYLSF